MSRITTFVCLLTMPLLSVVADPARAEDESASVEVRLPATPGSAELTRGQIYRILLGGCQAPDAELSRHLWRVAETLAAQQWSPPTVTIEVIVEEEEDGEVRFTSKSPRSPARG